MFLSGVIRRVGRFPECGIGHGQLTCFTSVDALNGFHATGQFIAVLAAYFFSNCIGEMLCGQWPRLAPQRKGASSNCWSPFVVGVLEGMPGCIMALGRPA